jgi:glycyl-tRNA synthetase (class II)
MQRVWIYFPSSEIYDGLQYDYAQNGVELKKNMNIGGKHGSNER